MTFILGMVGDPIPLKYIANPRPDRAAEVKGRQVLEKFNCGGCHLLFRSDGVRIPGLSARTEVSRTRPFQAVGVRADFLESQNRVMRGASPFQMGAGGSEARLGFASPKVTSVLTSTPNSQCVPC